MTLFDVPKICAVVKMGFEFSSGCQCAAEKIKCEYSVQYSTLTVTLTSCTDLCVPAASPNYKFRMLREHREPQEDGVSDTQESTLCASDFAHVARDIFCVECRTLF